jgi:ornithine--oxo-acid transaminase
VDAFITRIERRNPTINAFVYRGFDEARAKARDAEIALTTGQPLGPGDHGSTFGGNPIAAAAAVGLAALDTLIEERLVERVALLGPHLLSRLAKIKNPLIREARGRGLFAGIELDASKIRAGLVAERLLGAGILTKDTHRNTIRMAPPFVIKNSEIDWAVDRIKQVLDEVVEDTTKPLATA